MLHASRQLGRASPRRVQRTILSAAANKRLDELAARHEALTEQTQTGAHDVKAMRELHGLDDLLERRRALDAAASELDDLRELALDDDAEIRAAAEEELEDATATVAALEGAFKAKLAPGDATEEATSCLVEIRAAAGGDEASVFAKDLLGMYEKYCAAKGWRFATHDVRRTEFGGVSSCMAEVTGEGCYACLRWESGVHRVQRVPTNDVRIHTSTASVVVLPGADAAEVFTLNEGDVRIDTFRASGAGGQHVNTTDSAVRATNVPTNTVVSMQDERSQHRNKAKALLLLAQRVGGALAQQRAAAESEQRLSLRGSGDRSERIRTYNAPHDRVTDHRCQTSSAGVPRVLNGEIDVFVEALIQLDADERVAAFEAS